jgi:hypothetical protein
MTQPTSAQTYYSILNSGELGESQKKVLQLLLDHGPLTGTEVNEALRSRSGHKRLSELERMGVIRAGPPRPCRVTKREAVEWVVTGRTPAKQAATTDSTPSRSQFESAVEEIRALIRFRKLYDPAYSVTDDLYRVGIWLRKKGRS